MRDLQRPPFCYLCGRTIAPGDRANRDHVPPRSIFAVPDRDFPLILPTRAACNGGWSDNDDAIGQLVGVLHGLAVEEQNRRLRILLGRHADGALAAAAGGLDLRWIIRRCARGFHERSTPAAALHEAGSQQERAEQEHDQGQRMPEPPTGQPGLAQRARFVPPVLTRAYRRD